MRRRLFPLLFLVLYCTTAWAAAPPCELDPTVPSVTICTPADGATVPTTFRITGGTSTAYPIEWLRVFVDGALVYDELHENLDTNLTVAAGAHTVTVRARNTNGQEFEKSIGITAVAEQACTATADRTVNICAPANGASVTAPVRLVAAANSAAGVKSVKVYVNGTSVFQTTSSNVDTSLALGPPGTYRITVKAWDGAGEFSSTINVTVASDTPPACSASGTSVVICQPTDGGTVSTPVRVVAAASSPAGVKTVKIYVDGTSVYSTDSASVDTTLPLAESGRQYRLTVKAWDNTGASFSKTIYVNVSAGGCTLSTTSPSVTICQPANGATVSSPVRIVAGTTSANPVKTIKIYVDGTSVYSVNADRVDTSLAMSTGTHRVTVKAWDSNNVNFSSTINITVGSGGGTTTGLIAPARAIVTPATTQQFTSNSDVTWSVNGIVGGDATVGTITAGGLYSPPSAEGTYTVTATSKANTANTASATVYVSNFAGVYTYHNDNYRTGQNLDEWILTPTNVRASTFGKVFQFPVDGDVFAQPLYVAGVDLGTLGKRNVVYIVTQHNGVYAFDADGKQSAPLWYRNLNNPAMGITSIAVNTTDGTACCFSEIGITGTPVIDPATHTMFFVARFKENTTYTQKLYAVDIRTGANRQPPTDIQAKVPGSGVGNDGAGNVVFNTLRHNQRPGMLLVNGVLWITWASHNDVQPYHGWLMGYDATTLQQVAAWIPTPSGEGGGIWHSGGGPSADDSGNIYLVTGDGTFTADKGGQDYGDTFMKLNPSGGRLVVSDWFTPYNQDYLNLRDWDLGSGGAMLLPPQPNTARPNLLIAGSKEGRIYVIDRDNMGGHRTTDDNQIVQSLVGQIGVVRSMPGYWNGYVYFLAKDDYLKQFQLVNGKLTTTPVFQGTQLFGFPGATPSISASGAANGIVWVLRHSGGPALLYAYDATNVSKQLYSSGTNSTRDLTGNSVRFAVPTVANGRVYVGGKGQVTVFGLLP